MAEPFVCVNGIDLEAAMDYLDAWLANEYYMSSDQMQELLTAALGECIPATVEMSDRLSPAGRLSFTATTSKRLVSAWQPVEEDTEQ